MKYTKAELVSYRPVVAAGTTGPSQPAAINHDTDMGAW